MPCAKIGKSTCTLYEQKNPVYIQTLPAYTGIGDAETQSPGMLRKPGDLPQVCPRPKKFKRLTTRDILHGSRQNLRQRDPDDRIVPAPSDVSDKGAGTKRCARRKKKQDNYMYTYDPSTIRSSKKERGRGEGGGLFLCLSVSSVLLLTFIDLNSKRSRDTLYPTVNHCSLYSMLAREAPSARYGTSSDSRQSRT